MSNNRLEGARAGFAIARILSRKCLSRGGRDLNDLNLSQNKIQDAGLTFIVHELLQHGNELETLNLAYNEIIDLKMPYNLEMIYDKNFAVTNLNLNGNKFRIAAHKQFASLFLLAGPLTQLSMKACNLENEGLITTFEALKEQRRLKFLDFSSNSIFDRGIEGICPFIEDKHFKSHIEVIRFDKNDISDRGFKRFI